LFLKPGEVIVKRWNPEIEDFPDDEMSPDEAERFADGVRRFEFDQFLGAYPQDSANYSKWKQLSNYITPSVLFKLGPLGKKISSLYDHSDEEIIAQMAKLRTEGEGADTSNQNKDTANSHDVTTNQTTNKPNQRPYYSDVSRLAQRKAMKGMNPEMITKMSMDKSSILYELIKRYDEGPNGLLGELQFAFVCFLMGESYDGFEQWKQLVAIFCSCDEAMHRYSDLFYNFIEVFHFQLQQVPQDFFVDIISKNNFLFEALKGFYELLDDPSLDKKILKRATKFKQYIEERFGTQFTRSLVVPSEDDEDAPVVVSLDEYENN